MGKYELTLSREACRIKEQAHQIRDADSFYFKKQFKHWLYNNRLYLGMQVGKENVTSDANKNCPVF